MNRILNFSNRNIKEILRDPIVYVFCLVFPIVMLVLFQVVNFYVPKGLAVFNLNSLLPAIIMFSYTFVMLIMTLIVSKDRQTFFLKRLYSSPMKSCHFVLGYALVGFVIGVIQTIICVIAAFIISLITNVAFISFVQILLLIASQLPILAINVFLGILFGTIFNDKSAPGICSVVISLAGVLGGCWMPLETMGGFETFCRFLPFYPSVYIGRVVTNVNTFNSVAWLGVVPIVIYLVVSIVLSFVIFNYNMTNDK